MAEVRLFDADEIRRWPAGAFETLAQMGLLRQAEPSRTLMCDACADGHWEEPVILRGPGASRPRMYITCPEAGRVEVDPERARRWRVQLSGLAQLVADAMSLPGEPQELTADRLWDLGTARGLSGPERQLLLARGLRWRDAEVAFDTQLRPYRKHPSLLLALSGVPAAGRFYEVPVCSLAECARIRGGKLTLDLVQLKRAVTSVASVSSSTLPHSPDFRSVSAHGGEFGFTAQQAPVVKLLYEAYENGTPDVGQVFILSELGLPGTQLRDLFRHSEAWGTLIISGSTRGTFRLSP